jgi:hypothetical protein
MLTALLTMLPEEAVMLTVPVVVLPETSVTTPDVTVANDVLLDVHVATSVKGKDPLHVSASAENVSLELLPVNVKAGALVGVTLIDWMQPTVTVTVCVPVTDET